MDSRAKVVLCISPFWCYASPEQAESKHEKKEVDSMEERMNTPILVTGGTGTLGRHVVPRLRNAGCDVRVLSRRPHQAEDGIRYLIGDLATGEGIASAVD